MVGVGVCVGSSVVAVGSKVGVRVGMSVGVAVGSFVGCKVALRAFVAVADLVTAGIARTVGTLVGGGGLHATSNTASITTVGMMGFNITPVPLRGN